MNVARYYRITGLGGHVLDAEVTRMEQLTRTARLRQETGMGQIDA